jgi:hypothetical protein
MTTRYAELARLAIEDSRKFYEERSACSHCVSVAISKLVAHLQAPNDAVAFPALDGNLRATEETSDQPDLEFSVESVWHFAVRIHFRASGSLNYGVVTLYMSICPITSGYSIKFDERDFSVNPQLSDSFNSFIEYICSSLTNDYGKPRRTRRPQIGFTAGV